jgi:RimJ/RimL family protein N-acetyltransferase
MTAFPVLTTDRLTIRAPGADDVPAMLAFFGSEHANFYGGPMNADAAWHKFSAYVGQWTLRGYGMFSVTLKDSGDTIGMAGPHHPAHFPEPEMSWLLTDAAHEGKGYASEACRAVLHHLFTDLGWTTMISYIYRANTASRILAERLGATLDTECATLIEGCDTYRHTAESLA